MAELCGRGGGSGHGTDRGRARSHAVSGQRRAAKARGGASWLSWLRTPARGARKEPHGVTSPASVREKEEEKRKDRGLAAPTPPAAGSRVRPCRNPRRRIRICRPSPGSGSPWPRTTSAASRRVERAPVLPLRHGHGHPRLTTTSPPPLAGLSSDSAAAPACRHPPVAIEKLMERTNSAHARCLLYCLYPHLTRSMMRPSFQQSIKDSTEKLMVFLDVLSNGMLYQILMLQLCSALDKGSKMWYNTHFQ
ncbi:uncharacterized protein [Miscanthus floridulus]|uniref:uncharacterized protein n=1 Tax=Miscanthus floridulus TaxID=154761 RepID=UPI00345AAC58